MPEEWGRPHVFDVLLRQGHISTALALAERIDGCQLEVHHLPERNPNLTMCVCYTQRPYTYCNESAECASWNGRYSRSERCRCVGSMSCAFCSGPPENTGCTWELYGEATLEKVQSDAEIAAKSQLFSELASMKRQLPFVSDAALCRLCEIAILIGNKEPRSWFNMFRVMFG